MGSCFGFLVFVVSSKPGFVKLGFQRGGLWVVNPLSDLFGFFNRGITDSRVTLKSKPFRWDIFVFVQDRPLRTAFSPEGCSMVGLGVDHGQKIDIPSKTFLTVSESPRVPEITLFCLCVV